MIKNNFKNHKTIVELEKDFLSITPKIEIIRF